MTHLWPQRVKHDNKVYEYIFDGMQLTTKQMMLTSIKINSPSNWEIAGHHNWCILVIMSIVNIRQDEIEPRRREKARVAKDYGLDYMLYTLE